MNLKKSWFYSFIDSLTQIQMKNEINKNMNEW